MARPLIELQGVTKSFGGKEVLRGVDLTIEKGQITTIIGKSGGGKSVLLKHLVGLITPESGRIFFEGRDISRMKKEERRLWKKKISYVFQGTALFDAMTVFENIALALSEKSGLPRQKIAEKVSERMAQLDLKNIGDLYPSQISGGMKKRVALARALVTDPEIVLFDEPTTGLDPIRKTAVHAMISNYQKKFGFTGVVVSHDIPDIFFISQRVVLLYEGRIFFQGTPEAIRKSQEPVVKEFLQGLDPLLDDLTGMDTHTQLARRFEAEQDLMQRHATVFCLIVIAIDNLDEISEQLGHIKAQTVLSGFAVELSKHLRPAGTCSRYGMEKILAVLPNTNLEQAHRLCEQISREMSMHPLMEGSPFPELHFLIRAGFAEAAVGSSFEEVLAAAELNKNNMYSCYLTEPEVR